MFYFFIKMLIVEIIYAYIYILIILLHKTGRLSKKWAPLSETRHLYPELIQYII